MNSFFRLCKGSSSKCQSDEQVQLELKVVAQTPKVFVIENFLSAFEADAIIELARPKVKPSEVGDSGVGALTSETRTSKNTWVGRGRTEVTDTIYKRAADVLNLDEQLLNNDANAEHMQV